MKIIYTLLVYTLIPVAFARLWWRGRKNPAYRQRWQERLGFIPTQTQPCVWVHAVSVGESIAAIPLIRQLIATQHPVIVTTMTITGAERVQALFGDKVTHFYLAYDLPGAVKRFLQRAKPLVGIIMETEIWPNLYACCAQEKIPLLLVNARLSPKSLRNYSKFLPLFSPALNHLTQIAAQTKADAERFIALGAAPEKVSVMGNIKFDIEIPEKALIEGKALRNSFANRPVWIAASTHNGEEENVLMAFAKVREQHPTALLILVPRHPERFDKVADFIKQHNLSFTRRSTKDNSTLQNTDVFLGDTMGELLMFYAAADVAFVGGSLMPIGGHNVLEPAALSVPSITGPHTFNFTEIMQFMHDANASIEVSSVEDLANAVNTLFSDPAKRQHMGQLAHQIVLNNSGAMKNLWDIVEKFI